MPVVLHRIHAPALPSVVFVITLTILVAAAVYVVSGLTELLDGSQLVGSVLSTPPALSESTSK